MSLGVRYVTEAPPLPTPWHSQYTRWRRDEVSERGVRRPWRWEHLWPGIRLHQWKPLFPSPCLSTANDCTEHCVGTRHGSVQSRRLRTTDTLMHSPPWNSCKLRTWIHFGTSYKESPQTKLYLCHEPSSHREATRKEISIRRAFFLFVRQGNFKWNGVNHSNE